jgi:hypothetical protein
MLETMVQTIGLVLHASNQNQNQCKTMTLVWFGFNKPCFWFAGFKPNQEHH